MSNDSTPVSISAQSSLKRARLLFTPNDSSMSNEAIAASIILPPLHDPVIHKASVLRKLQMRRLTFEPNDTDQSGMLESNSSSSSTMKVLNQIKDEALNLQGLSSKSKSKKKKRTSNALSIIDPSTSKSSLGGLSGIRASDENGTLIVHKVQTNEHERENENHHILALPSTKKGILTKSSKSTRIPKPKWHAPWRLSSVISSHLGWVRSVAFDPTNEMFATGGADRVIKIFDLAKASVGREDALKITLTGHVGPVRGLAFSERHPYMFSAGEDKQVKVNIMGCWLYVWIPICLIFFFLHDSVLGFGNESSC